MKQHKFIAARSFGKRTMLVMGIAMACGMSGQILAQSSTGSIFGSAPIAAGETVLVQNEAGFSREVPVDAKGRYATAPLPLGTYTVSLKRDGTTLDSRNNVRLIVGAATQVSFDAVPATNATNLGTLTVTASALPSIDVSGVDSRTVITSQELATLPLGRSAESIALLAPGVVQASGLFVGPTGGAVLSFGGSSATENAYYINGFNTTDPLNGFGGLTLPYGSISQQEILIGGYGAAYGRSDGGVISQIGKSGTNEWHFGGQVQWTPTQLQSDPRDYYYVSGTRAGQIRQTRRDNKAWTTTVDAYAGGPLIKDKLFFFGSVEGQRVQGQSTGSVVAPYVTHYRYDNPKWYGKLDWNINDSNILELTGVSNKSSYQGVLNKYSYATGKEGAFNNNDTSTKKGSDLYSAKFTSYITDSLTLTALYGKMKSVYYSATPGYDPTYPFIINPDQENPAISGGNIIRNSQTLLRLANPAHASQNTNLRLDLSYKLGDHTITAGIDNQNVSDINDGTVTSGPGYAWEYNLGKASTYIVGTAPTDPAFVDAPGKYPGGATGYYVARYINSNSATVRTIQRAQYVQDSWQVTDRWLVKLGLRNDQFTNLNSAGVPYLRLTKPQWAPRVGFSWDVNGDSSFKVYGNAGRYYLALPSSVALRSAGSSLYTREYFTYTGIDPNGIPTGLTPIKSSTGGPISANLEYGIPRDPKTATTTDLKSEYQDEYILGFDKKWNDAWTYGAKATYRDLRNAIDDIGDSFAIQAKMNALGIDPATYDPNSIQGSYLMNPGRTGIYRIPKLAGGYYSVPMDWYKDFHFNTTLKRHYYGLNFYLEHPFDGKWFAHIDYLYSRSYGNSEGQIRSDIGQADVSATVDWDYAQVMDYANGSLSNDRRHQIKAYGSYQLTSEWMLAGNLAILSGSPRSCLGYYGPGQTNPGLGYGPYYHFCGGQPSPPGKTHNPWTYALSLSAEYRPEWAARKLAFNASVFNVLNSQKITQTYAIYGNSANVNTNYLRPYTSQTPRYVRLGVSYDF